MSLRRFGLLFNSGSDGSNSIKHFEGREKTIRRRRAEIEGNTPSSEAENGEKSRLTITLKLGKKNGVTVPNAQKVCRTTSDSGEISTGAGSASGEAQRGSDDGESSRDFNREQRTLEVGRRSRLPYV